MWPNPTTLHYFAGEFRCANTKVELAQQINSDEITNAKTSLPSLHNNLATQ
jgi:hypothetical protein